MNPLFVDDWDLDVDLEEEVLTPVAASEAGQKLEL